MSLDKTIALICTTFNCRDEIEPALSTFISDSNLKMLNEIVILDGGSTDSTWECLQEYTDKVQKLKVYQEPGANISRGRNGAIERTSSDIIVTFDSGTIYQADWLSLMLKPFEDNSVKVVGGTTEAYGKTVFEKCLAAFKDPGRIGLKPSHRGCAFYKEVWSKIGGYPEHVPAGEDTWFNSQWQKMGYKYVNVPAAVNLWRVRGTWKGMFKMARRNFKGHVALGETSSAFKIFLIMMINVSVFLLCLPVGFWDFRIWLVASGLYFIYLMWRLFGKARWRYFINPLRFCVGIYVLTSSDWGTSVGVIEGAFLFLKHRIFCKIRGIHAGRI